MPSAAAAGLATMSSAPAAGRPLEKGPPTEIASHAGLLDGRAGWDDVRPEDIAERRKRWWARRWIQCALNPRAAEAQHVHDADLRDGDPEELGTLVHDGAHQQTAVRASLNRQPGRRSVLLFDEPLGGGDEVVEDVLLLELHPLLVPLLTVFATTSDIR